MNALLTAVLSAALCQQPLDLEFEQGVSGWRTVVDGVMGGLSTGRVASPEPGLLRFSGEISLENNGGFSQIRSATPEDAFNNADGVEIRVRGDGRTYKFDVRCSNIRVMAGAYQQDFGTQDGEWTTIRLPFENFRLYSFGRRVDGAPPIAPANIESIGVTLADKTSGRFQLDVDAIRAYADASPRTEPLGDTSFVSVASSANLTTLLDLIDAADLEIPDGVTIFAPTNEAIAALPDALRRTLTSSNGADALRALLTHHVAGGQLAIGDLLSRRTVDTLGGQRVALSGSLMIDDASVVAADIRFDGGVIQVIDQVLRPEQRPLADVAAERGTLTTLLEAVGAAGLDKQLSAENGPWTIIAPTDSAFAALPAGALESLLESHNRSDLQQLLGAHVIPGRIYADELLAVRQAETFFGEPVEFSLSSGALRAGNATILVADIEAGNGVIHIVDRVLTPERSQPEASSDIATSSAAAKLCELAINRGVPLFNAGQPAACAAVYEVAVEALLSLADLDQHDRLVLERARKEASESHSWRDRAWIYRRALDEVYASVTGQESMTSAAR